MILDLAFLLAIVFFDCFDIQGGFSYIPLNPEPKNFAHNVQGLSGRLYSYTDLFSGSPFSVPGRSRRYVPILQNRQVGELNLSYRDKPVASPPIFFLSSFMRCM